VAVLQHLGGAIAHVPLLDAAYANRDAIYDCFPVAIWQDPADDEANARWAQEFWTAMRPSSNDPVYVNNHGDEGEDCVRAANGANYQRLASLKGKYDPTNFYPLNQNVRPAS
jgi:Berberine and berberine like